MYPVVPVLPECVHAGVLICATRYFLLQSVAEYHRNSTEFRYRINVVGGDEHGDVDERKCACVWFADRLVHNKRHIYSQWWQYDTDSRPYLKL